MKKIIAFAFVALTSITAAPNDADRRVDASRLATDESRVYRGDNRGPDRWDGRVADDLFRLRREVQQVRGMIGESSTVSRNIRDRFHRVLRTTDLLEDQFRRRRIGGWEVRRRADGVRAELDEIRRDLRRFRGHGRWGR